MSQILNSTQRYCRNAYMGFGAHPLVQFHFTNSYQVHSCPKRGSVHTFVNRRPGWTRLRCVCFTAQSGPRWSSLLQRVPLCRLEWARTIFDLWARDEGLHGSHEESAEARDFC